MNYDVLMPVLRTDQQTLQVSSDEIKKMAMADEEWRSGMLSSTLTRSPCLSEFAFPMRKDWLRRIYTHLLSGLRSNPDPPTERSKNERITDDRIIIRISLQTPSTLTSILQALILPSLARRHCYSSLLLLSFRESENNSEIIFVNSTV
jgi:hypothetical protein